MNGYYLVSNMIYNCKHIIKQRWYHIWLFGDPSLTVDFIEAANQDMAEKKFRLKGHNFGVFH